MHGDSPIRRYCTLMDNQVQEGSRGRFAEARLFDDALVVEIEF